MSKSQNLSTTLRKIFKMSSAIVLSAFFCISAFFAIFYIAETVQMPAWVEIYSHALFPYIYGNFSGDTLACNIEGCSVLNESAAMNMSSTQWHLNLFGMIDNVYVIAFFSFASGALLVLLIDRIYNYKKSKY